MPFPGAEMLDNIDDAMILSYDDTIMANPTSARNLVKLHRLQRDWSQVQLAQRVGVSRAAISAIESHRLVPSVATALSLARVFGCSVESLFPLGPTQNPGPEWAWHPSRTPCR